MSIQALQDVIIERGSTLEILLAAITMIDFLLLFFLDIQILIHDARTVFPSLVDFKIPTGNGFEFASRNVTAKELHIANGFRMT